MNRHSSQKSTPPASDRDGGQTKAARDGEAEPKLPHERDQSADSQQDREGSTSRVGKQAFDDVESGLVDTDRGPVTQRVYEGVKKP